MNVSVLHRFQHTEADATVVQTGLALSCAGSRIGQYNLFGTRFGDKKDEILRESGVLSLRFQRAAEAKQQMAGLEYLLEDLEKPLREAVVVSLDCGGDH